MIDMCRREDSRAEEVRRQTRQEVRRSGHQKPGRHLDRPRRRVQVRARARSRPALAHHSVQLGAVAEAQVRVVLLRRVLRRHGRHLLRDVDRTRFRADLTDVSSTYVRASLIIDFGTSFSHFTRCSFFFFIALYLKAGQRIVTI